MGKCLECAATFGIVFLAILNIVTCLLGIGIMVVGILLKEEINKESDILDFLDEVNFGSITVKQIIEIVFIAVIVLGVFTTITSLSGCIGAICKLRPLLIIYIVILVLCILVELTVLGFWVTLMQGTNEALKGEFNNLLEKYAGATAKDVYSVGWNVIFILFNCCGVEPITATNNDFQSLPSQWWASSGSDNIPASCCKDATRENYDTYSNTQCTQSLQNYYTSGCYDAFQNLFTQLATIAISISTVIVVIEAVAIFFSIVIIVRVTTSKSSKVV